MAEPNSELKMWLAVRTDLPLSRGKLATQSGHAYQWLTVRAMQQIPEVFQKYLRMATPKITVRVDGEGALHRVAEEAKKAGIPFYLVHDAGRSEVEPGTATVCAFGPAYREDLPSFLKRLQLLKDDE